jgi:hypothetical protein
MTGKRYSRGNTSLIGRLLIRHNPTLAANLLAEYVPHRTDKSIQEIPFWLARFMKYFKISETDFKLKNNQETVYYKRLFAGAVVEVLDPDSLKYGTRIKGGVVKALAQSLHYTSSAHTTRLIREAVVYAEIYDDFKKSLTQTLKLIQDK